MKKRNITLPKAPKVERVKEVKDTEEAKHIKTGLSPKFENEITLNDWVKTNKKGV